jgi:predicted nucleotidyltransferase
MKNTSFARQPLDAILTGSGSVRVMRVLLSHGGSLSVTRLAQEARMTPDGVKGVLRDLERRGVGAGLGSDRTRLFRAIARHPVVAALDSLFSAERARFDDILASVTAAAADERIVAAWLFGGAARAEDTIDSDLDVAIIIDADVCDFDDIADRVRDVLRESEKQMSFTASIVALPLVDIPRLRSERSPLWSGLSADARILKGPPPERILEQGRVAGATNTEGRV